jgi:hypothetical protein
MDGRTDKYSGTDFNCTGWLMIQTISLGSQIVSFSIKHLVGLETFTKAVAYFYFVG